MKGSMTYLRMKPKNAIRMNVLINDYFSIYWKKLKSQMS